MLKKHWIIILIVVAFVPLIPNSADPAAGNLTILEWLKLQMTGSTG
jgi:hypothetical protein